jgi:hypothetical protein
MSATKRTHHKRPGWLQPGEIPKIEPDFRDKVLAYPEARLALTRITGSVLTAELVWLKIWELACRMGEVRLKGGRKRKGKRKRENAPSWYSLSGFQSYTLQRYPKKVRGWAEEIDTLNKAIQSNRAYGLTAHSLQLFLESEQQGQGIHVANLLPEDLTHRLKEKSADLPKLHEISNLLSLYADRLEAVFGLTAAYASEAPRRYEANLIWALLDSVLRVTGRPHFQDIATLLTATYHAKGSNKIWNAHDLKMRYRRFSPPR